MKYYVSGVVNLNYGSVCRVVDPYSFFTDPDPIRIQGFEDQKLKKKTAEKKIKFF
jgi:hypothetical protein